MPTVHTNKSFQLAIVLFLDQKLYGGAKFLKGGDIPRSFLGGGGGGGEYLRNIAPLLRGGRISCDAGPLRENNGPLKVLLSQSQSAISPEVMLAI